MKIVHSGLHLILLVFAVSAVQGEQHSEETLEGSSLKPYTVRDKVTIEGTLDRYPYLVANMNPRALAERVNQFPDDLKNELYIATFTHYNHKTIVKCYREGGCRATPDFKATIDAQSQKYNMSDFYFVMICRDELHDVSIKKYLRRNKVQEPQFTKQLKFYHQKLLGLPAFLLSIDLASDLERNKFVVPDSYMLYTNWEGTLKETNRGSEKYPWDQKVSKIFWRGGDSGSSYDEVDVWSDLPKYYPRIELIRLSSIYPEKIDAELTYIYEPGVKENLIRKGLEQKIASTGRVAIQDHMKYKYLISIDGWTTAWMRVPWILSSNSLLIKQDSNKVSWYDWQLKPNVNYFPINNNLSNILEVYQQLQKDQVKVKAIIKQSNEFAKKQFVIEKIFEQLLTTISNYSIRQSYTFTESTKLLFDELGRPFQFFANLTDAQIDAYRAELQWKGNSYKIARALLGLILFYAVIVFAINFNCLMYIKYKWRGFLLSCVDTCRGTSVADFIFKKKLEEDFAVSKPKSRQLSL